MSTRATLKFVTLSPDLRHINAFAAVVSPLKRAETTSDTPFQCHLARRYVAETDKDNLQRPVSILLRQSPRHLADKKRLTARNFNAPTPIDTQG